MKKIAIWEIFGKLSKVLKKLGLGRVVDTSRKVFKTIFRDSLTIETSGILLTGSIDQRSYLFQLRDSNVEHFTRKVFVDLIKPGMVVLDVGACIGVYSILAARKLEGRGRVYSFEPDFRNYQYLFKNINQNNFSDIITPVESAVSDKKETISFNLGTGMRTGSSRYAKYRSGNDGILEVNAVSLDEFLDKEIIVDVIKIDVEGSELDALDGMKEVIKRSYDKIIIIIECNPRTLYYSGTTPAKLIDKLRSLDLDVLVIDGENQTLSPVTDRTYKDFYFYDSYPDMSRPNENHYFIENLFCYAMGRDVNIGVIANFGVCPSFP
ncbi:MAG: FkbM family methyltransferase [Nitrospirae bacterium]|nr:FkbM family methyltransferase [Nitrospirota bacterium]